MRRALEQTSLNRSHARGGQKCYNFKLATDEARTASCISTQTATLLLVVDWYSQVLGAAVYEYAQLISNLNPPS